MGQVNVGLLITSSFLGLFLAVYIVARGRTPGSKALSLIILGASLWSLGYAFELTATDLGFKLFWEKIEYIGIIIIPLAWFTFVYQYLGSPAGMKRLLRYWVLLAIIPVVTLILVWTNESHGLVWRLNPEQPTSPFSTLNFTHGPWFWVLMIYSYALMLLASARLGISLFSVMRLQRWQLILAMLAILLPWVGNIPILTGLSPEFYLDWAAFVFLISGVLFSISLFRFQLLNILPIAQETVFAGLADCVLVLDMNGYIVDLNPSAKKAANCPGGKGLGKSLAQLMPQLVPFIQQAGLDKEYNTEVSWGEAEDEQYFDLHISLLGDHNSNPIGRVMVLHPITQFKRDQAELERARDHLEGIVMQRTQELRQAFTQLQQELIQRTLAEKRFEDVIEFAPDAMFLLDQSGRILYINAMAEQMFGYRRADLIDKNFVESLFPPQQRSSQRNYFLQLLENPTSNQTSFGVDLLGSRKDGQVFPMEVDVSRLDAADGYWMAVDVHDISERKLAEAALRESEQTYRALFENAGDAILLSDLEGRITQVNHKATRLLGFSQAELQSLTIADITIMEEQQDVRRKIDHLVKGGQLEPYMRRYLKRSGEVVHTENFKVLVKDANGKPLFFQNVARDISERIKAQQAQNRLLEEVRQSNEQMRTLALRLQEVQESERQELAVELHDRVGQNLTGLNLNLKILQNHLLPEASPGVAKRLQESLQLVEETTHKIRDVMADLDPPVLDEYGLLAAIKWYCDEFSTRTGITTRVRGDKPWSPLAASVEKILYRHVQEALNNVVKHANATRVDIGLKSGRDGVSLVVKDNGIGFDPHAVNGRSSHPHWGFLSMQQRAESIGAKLEIDSAPGRGTQVFVKVGRDQHDD